MGSARGHGLVEILAAVAIGVLALGVAVPALDEMRASARIVAGARHVGFMLHALRWHAVTRARGQGLIFGQDALGWYWHRVEDGNGNGLRTAEIADGTDVTVSGPHRLENEVSGVTFGFPPLDSVPQIPPRSGRLDDLDDPIRIGNTSVLGFSPLGTAGSGTLYVTDGARGLMAIVLYGKTTRLRLWRYDAEGDQWTRH